MKAGTKGQRILITGSRGFIGRGLCRTLRSRGHAVTELDYTLGYDINNPLIPQGLDAIVHLAALLTTTSLRLLNYLFSVNVSGTLKMLEGAAQMQVPKFIFISSAAVYECRTVYGASKLAGEAYCRAATANGLVDTKILRLFNVYGPGQSAKSGALVPRVLEALFNRRDIVVHGDGEQTRDFIYIEDVVKSIVNEIETSSFPSATPMDLGCGREVSVNQVVELLRDHYAHEVSTEQSSVVYENLPGPQPRASCAQLQSPVSDLATTFCTLDEGLRETTRFWQQYIMTG